jgi:hypothetical protein
VEHRGFILIADITGYTSYLNESELEHAQGTLTDLLELMVEYTRSPLVVAQLEGDAVMSYAFEEGFVSGQTFLESIEDTYVAFRRAIELMVLNNTCQCNACANVSSLDLKFFVHFGTFVLQPVDDRIQLVGADINLIHRLLKNSVTNETGIRAYVLCTAAAVEALGLDTNAQDMVDHKETVPDFGVVALSIKDMHPVYEERRDAERITFAPEEVLGTLTTEISMPRELVWDYLNQSEFRNLIIGSDHQEVLDRKAGRIGPGSTYQCYHGKMTVPQLILEWTPFERVLVRQLVPFPPLPGQPTYTFLDYQLTTTEMGTKLDQTMMKPAGTALKRGLAQMMIRMMKKVAQRNMDSFRDAIQDDQANREVSPATPAVITTDDLKSAAASSLLGNDEGV